MNDNKEFEHEIDPDLLAEIEEWEKTDHDEPAEYYFSNPDPYLKPQQDLKLQWQVQKLTQHSFPYFILWLQKWHYCEVSTQRSRQRALSQN